MDLDLIHTFLELEQAGTMGKAGDRLAVTQATVSARIAQLEAELGKRLFHRNKAGTRLTDEGRTFLPYARRLVGTWNDAARHVSDGTNQVTQLSVGGEYTLSTALLLNWLVALRTERPGASIRTVVDSAARLLDSVQSGALDVVTLYSPLRRAKLRTRMVLQEELVCVSTEQNCLGPTVANYIYVDWGPDFTNQHERMFPELSRAALAIGLGPLALRYLLKMGGTGYFRTRAVQPYLKDKRLYLVPTMPSFSYSIYAVTLRDADSTLIDWALDALASSSRELVEPWA